MAEETPRRVFNLKAALTIIMLLVFLTVIGWSVYVGKLDPLSFLTGLSPFVGIMLKDLFGGSA